MLQKQILLPSSGEMVQLSQLVPLEKANPNPQRSIVKACKLQISNINCKR